VSKTFPVTMGRSGIQMVENLQIYDMVWGMAHLNRFTGKADRQVSVLAHSLHCHAIACLWKPDNVPLRLYALVHDLPEAYYGDFPGFLKNDLGADFTATLARIDDLVFDQLGLTKDVRLALEPDLKDIDSNALALEAAYAFDKFEPYHWPSMDIYDELDILEDCVSQDDISLYNNYNMALSLYGENNANLQDLLHNHRGYSHPVRRNVR
jgi:5'-deoxynucleotidase YfbR-like HD superfamily hydrolase